MYGLYLSSILASWTVDVLQMHDAFLWGEVRSVDDTQNHFSFPFPKHNFLRACSQILSDFSYSSELEYVNNGEHSCISLL